MDSYIEIGPKGPTSFVGRDAVEIFRVKTLIGALKLLAVGITPTRGMTRKRALALTTQVTGKPYKRGLPGLTQAQADLQTWLEVAITSIPIQQAP